MSHAAVVMNPKSPCDDVEDDEDENAKTGGTPIYIVGLKLCFTL